MKRQILVLVMSLLMIMVSACGKQEVALGQYHDVSLPELQKGTNEYLKSLESELVVSEFVDLNAQDEDTDDETAAEDSSDATDTNEDSLHAFEAVVSEQIRIYISYDMQADEGFIGIVFLKDAIEEADIDKMMADYVAVISGVITTLDPEADLSGIYSELDENLQIDYHSSKYEDEEYIFYYHYIKEVTIFVIKRCETIDTETR